MLDNFGMGEFLMLALFALLFFGPERLPQMGARIGRWLSQLTQASKVFMTQWTEEAAAIQDAVREVQGIRDEIRAAQAEISGSLDIARQDIEQTIGEARSTVRDAAVTPQSIANASRETQANASAPGAPATGAPVAGAPGADAFAWVSLLALAMLCGVTAASRTVLLASPIVCSMSWRAMSSEPDISA